MKPTIKIHKTTKQTALNGPDVLVIRAEVSHFGLDNAASATAEGSGAVSEARDPSRNAVHWINGLKPGHIFRKSQFTY